MISASLKTPTEVSIHMAKAARLKRLSLNLSQYTVAERSGVSLSVLKKFEQTGKISLASLLKLALVLEALADFEACFQQKAPASFRTLDELLEQKTRQRGRQ